MNKTKQKRLKTSEKELLKLTEKNLQEWNSKEDNEQFKYLQKPTKLKQPTQ